MTDRHQFVRGGSWTSSTFAIYKLLFVHLVSVEHVCSSGANTAEQILQIQLGSSNDSGNGKVFLGLGKISNGFPCPLWHTSAAPSLIRDVAVALIKLVPL